MYDDLSNTDKELLDSGPSYTIPWDIAFKPDSSSTPARPVFDASSKTSAGCSLNDNLVKGRTDLVNLFGMVLGWLVGPIGVIGDISQFYNSVLLDKDHWKFQKVVWFENLDHNTELKRGILRTLINGVRCVSAQTKHVKKLLQAKIREDAVNPYYEEVANCIRDFFYINDGGCSVKTFEEAHNLT